MNIIPRETLFDFDRFFHPFGHDHGQLGKAFDTNFFSPRVDVTEKDDEYIIKAELAGVKKEDVDVSVNNNVLTITAKTDTERKEEKDGKVIRQERRVGTYTRSFHLAENTQESDINASFKDGLLTLNVPKVAPTQVAKKTIEIN